MSIERFIGDMVFLHGVDKQNQKMASALDDKFDLLDQINDNQYAMIEELQNQVESLENQVEYLKNMVEFLEESNKNHLSLIKSLAGYVGLGAEDE